jgi:large subunit ribosomal protein L29
MATAEELRQMDGDELRSRLGETKQELFNLRFQLVTGQLDNSERLGQVRRDVARMLTVLREREIEEAEALEAAANAGGGNPGLAGGGAS